MSLRTLQVLEIFCWDKSISKHAFIFIFITKQQQVDI